MTQEEKQLLLKDLCARLPYGIKCYEADVEYTFDIIGTTTNNKEFIFSDGYERNLEQIKPYLRPMSSMTEEEREEVQVFICDEWFFEDSGFATKVRKEGYIEFLANYDCSGIDPEFCGEYADWLTAHHFDYRGLIEKGLALEAPEGMYKE